MKKIQITARTRAPEPITQSVLDKAVDRGKMRHNTDKAIRLADELEFAASQIDAEDDVIHVARWFVEDAAAELRRLHEEIDQWRVAVTNAERERDIAGSQRTALLEALKLIANTNPVDAALDPQRAVSVANAAIKQAEGDNT